MLHFSSHHHSAVTLEATFSRAAENPDYPIQRALDAFGRSFNRHLPDAIHAPTLLAELACNGAVDTPAHRISCRP